MSCSTASNLGDIGVVTDTKDEINSSLLLRRYVLDHIPPDTTVRNDERLVIERHDGRVNQAHVINLTEYALCLDDITDIKRSIEKNHHAGSEVRQCVLQSKTNDETGNTKTGE